MSWLIAKQRQNRTMANPAAQGVDAFAEKDNLGFGSDMALL